MELSELWASGLEWLNVNSAWIIALISAALGSVAGSWWTQRATEKREHVAAGKAELRAINRAIMVCFAVVNGYMSIKKQHVHKLVADYNACQNEAKAVLATGTGEVVISADLSTIPAPRASANRLEDLVFNDIRVGGRALSAVTELVEVQHRLQNALTQRDALIEEFRAKKLSGQDFAQTYLALKQPGGNVDARYQDCMRGIGLYTDDCIFFAMIAGYDLRKHGERLIQDHHGRIGSIRKNLHNVDWSAKDDAHLKPKSADYANWTKGFVESSKWWNFWKGPTVVKVPF